MFQNVSHHFLHILVKLHENRPVRSKVMAKKLSLTWKKPFFDFLAFFEVFRPLLWLGASGSDKTKCFRIRKSSATILDIENFGLGQKVPRPTSLCQAEIFSKIPFDLNIFSQKNTRDFKLHAHTILKKNIDVKVLF